MLTVGATGIQSSRVGADSKSDDCWFVGFVVVRALRVYLYKPHSIWTNEN